MKKIKKLFFVLLLGCSSQLWAQSDAMLNFSWSNPLRTYYSPSLPYYHDAYIALPALSGINAQVYNAFLPYNDIFIRDAEGYPVSIQTEQFLQKLKKENWLSLNTNINLLGFGFRVNSKLFLSLDIRFRADISAAYSKDLFGLILQGNMAYLGDENPARLAFKANVNAYQEYGVGVQYKLPMGFTLGVRPKLLFGAANLQTRTLAADLYTHPETYALRMHYDAAINASLPFPYQLSTDTIGFDFAGFSAGNLFRNVGGAIDLALRYEIDSIFSVNLGVRDLGFIRWKSNCVELTSVLADNGDFYNDGFLQFEGVTETQLEQLMNNDEYLNQVLDSVVGYFPLNDSVIAAYNTMLNPKIYAQFDAQLNKNHKFSLLAQGEFIGKWFNPSLTVAYSGFYGKTLELGVAYTIKKRSFANLGVSLGLHLRAVTLYAACSDVLTAFKPSRLSNCSVQAGLIVHWRTKKFKETLHNSVVTKYDL